VLKQECLPQKLKVQKHNYIFSTQLSRQILPAGLASTVVTALRMLKWKRTAAAKTLPPLPVPKSFTLPRVNHLISLPVCICSDAAARRPRSHSFPAATGCSGATASQATAPGVPGLSQRGRKAFPLPPTRGGSDEGPLASSPARGRKQENLPAPLRKPGVGKRGAGHKGLLGVPTEPVPKAPGLVRTQQDAAGERGGSHDFRGSPGEGASRRSPSLLAGFPGTGAQGEHDGDGMSQVKRKSQRMEGRENAALKTGGNSKRKARVNKRNNWQKEHARYKGKKKKHGGTEKIEENYSVGEKNSNEGKQEKKKAL